MRTDRIITIDFLDGDSLEIEVYNVSNFIPDAMLIELYTGIPFEKGGRAA